MKHAATVTGDQTGIVMDVYTEEPGCSFMVAILCKAKTHLRADQKMNSELHFVLETQHFPDSPNQPAFSQQQF